jgi:hypothetical protein
MTRETAPPAGITSRSSPPIILRRYLTSGTWIHLSQPRPAQGNLRVCWEGEQRQPKPGTGWLDNRNRMIFLPTGSGLSRAELFVCPGTRQACTLALSVPS